MSLLLRYLTSLQVVDTLTHMIIMITLNIHIHIHILILIRWKISLLACQFYVSFSWIPIVLFTICILSKLSVLVYSGLS